MSLDADGDTSRASALGTQACLVSSCSPDMAQGVKYLRWLYFGANGVFLE